MAVNKLALIRYKVIDSCLQNRLRKWTLDDLVTACSDALYEYEGIRKGVSKRTVQLDIQNMRSEKIGYNAPIVVLDKRYYTYEDKKYSITNIPLTQQDLGTLGEVVGILKQFKGFGYFQELAGMVSRLEDKIHTHTKGKSFINFEKNELLKGLDYIERLHKAIQTQTVLEVYYRSFKARSGGNITLHPYLLKEYRNRWFVVGVSSHKSKPVLLTAALDRIISIKDLPGEQYIQNTIIDVDTYFDDTIGVTKRPGQPCRSVILKVDREHAPYVLTKPLHASQTLLKEDHEGIIISLQVIWNFELERELLGFGECLTVLSPKGLVKRMKHRVVAMGARYREVGEGVE